jgi:4-hydroxy-2-oxoheptanedioate aldolase
MRENTLKSKLAGGRAVVGAFVRMAAPALVEMCAYAGFDFVALDAEHGPLSVRDVEDLVRAAEARDIPVLVRVPDNSPSVILRYLDTGASGIHVPEVNTVEQALAAVHAVKYHPAGTRGLAGSRAAGFGLAGPLSEYVRQANRETMVITAIENIEGVRHASEIANVDGVDVVFVGPVDLSHSLGVPGQTGAPDVQAAVADTVVQVKASGKVLGTIASDAESAQARLREGYRYLVIGTERLLVVASREFLQAVRG